MQQTVKVFQVVKGRLGVKPRALKGIPIESKHTGYGDYLPGHLQAVFAAVKSSGQPYQVVTCRMPGVPANAKGTHQRHYVVQASERIRLAGSTL